MARKGAAAPKENGGAFFCTGCGTEMAHWAGRCPECKEWDTIVQAPRAPRSAPGMKSGRLDSGVRLSAAEQARPVGEIPEPDLSGRLSVPLPELARVLGGHIVPGSAVLVAGDPGVGKSTLLLTLADRLAASGERCLYAACEESAGQTRLRAKRLGAGARELLVLADSRVESVLAECARLTPSLVVVDSIQAIWSPEFPGAAGSVGQVRQCAAALIRQVKESGAALFLVGHVTKDGTIAGPRVLEHMVDTVLHFEPAGQGSYRQLRAVKNRFGPTDEVAFFEMTPRGLAEISEPSALLLGERDADRPGAAAFPAVMGSRVLVVEIQALAAPAAENYAHRRAQGLDANRLHMLLAVLARRGELKLAGCDVFANAAGGLEVCEPAADLPLAVAVAGSLRDRAVSRKTALAGEVGLGGELRPVPRAAERVREAARHGFERMILPRGGRGSLPAADGIKVIGAASLGEALDLALA